ncbi:hypothetical protein, partial [Enterococcus faecium]|uniref:hypothetical protein n=7 Tax=cellular organisms TaxID=131567 RepID=UPI0013D21223
LAASFSAKYGNLFFAVESPASAVSVAFFGCLPASALVMVVAKSGSFPSAAASSFSVFSASGDASITSAIAASTKAVFAIWVLFVPLSAVGAVGVPVSAGLSSGLFCSFHPLPP